MAITTSVQADPINYEGFSVNPSPYYNEVFQGKGDGSFYTVKFTADSDLYLLNHFTSFWDTVSEALPTMGITQYGYYKNGSTELEEIHTIGSGENDVQPTSFTFELDKTKAGRDSFTTTGYYLGSFKAGDEIEIWMTDGTTSVSSNTPYFKEGEEGGQYTGRFDGRSNMITTYSANGTVIPVAQLYLYDSTGYQVNFGLYAESPKGGSGNAGLNGAPLPGGLQIALIAGLFGLGFWYVRRRKSVVA